MSISSCDIEKVDFEKNEFKVERWKQNQLNKKHGVLINFLSQK